MRTKLNLIGVLVLAATFMTWLSGVGDTVKELQDWHGAGSPAIVGVLMSQFGKLFSAAIGGLLINIRSSDERDRVTDQKLNEINRQL